jgi:type I restriction enzyme S subunit
MNIERVPLGRLVRSMRNGLSPATGGDFTGDVLTLSAVTHGRFDDSARKSAAFGQRPRDDQMVRPGMFLICRGNGNVDLVGAGVVVPPGVSARTVFPDTVIGVELKEAMVDPTYLAYAWTTSEARAQIIAGARTTNGTYKVNQQVLEAIQLPLPALAEQHRIAAILNEADTLRRKRREAPGLLDELLRSAFLEMFGDPVTNPRGWPRRNLRTVISDIEPGWSVSGTDRPAASMEWGVLKVSAVSTGLFLPDENKMVQSPEFVKPPVVPRRGDLLFSRANTRELVAATCLVDADVERVFLPDKLWRISCFAEVAVVEWLRFLLANDGFRHTLTKHATKTSGSMLNVSQDKLLGLEAPVPPVADQRRFAALVWAAVEERSRVNCAVRAVDEMFDSLMHRAFAGERWSDHAT